MRFILFFGLALLIGPTLAGAQPATFSGVTAGAWELIHEVNYGPGGQCVANTRQGRAEFAYIAAGDGTETFLVISDGAVFRRDAPTPVRFTVRAELDVTLPMHASGLGGLSYVIPTPRPPPQVEALFTRIMFSLLDSRNISISLPGAEPFEFPTASATIAAALRRCLAFVAADRAAGR